MNKRFEKFEQNFSNYNDTDLIRSARDERFTAYLERGELMDLLSEIAKRLEENLFILNGLRK